MYHVSPSSDDAGHPSKGETKYDHTTDCVLNLMSDLDLNIGGDALERKGEGHIIK